MRATGIFTVKDFAPASVFAEPPIRAALDMSVATMEKEYHGAVEGRSATIFTSAFDPELGVGTYVAMEAFEGSLDGNEGTFAFVHSASTSGSERANEYFLIVPGSGTGGLAGITGAGSLEVDEDGTHHMTFEYTLAS
ncbi:DUF3224 domain-containing protein [Planctomonas deserti]|uniref:DUF3224 domain-containing protein n=1 Tax=Planctomonas deserti TaxID=2144185 RepID=UPI000D3DCA90|nr:DUF3224 domain-containing protein [Planctomonas deserti]